MKKLYEKLIRWGLSRADQRLYKMRRRNKKNKGCFVERIMEKHFYFLVDALIHCIGEKQLYDEMHGEEEWDY